MHLFELNISSSLFVGFCCCYNKLFEVIISISFRSLVMIGDCNPHGPNYPLNNQKINWRTECATLKNEGQRDRTRGVKWPKKSGGKSFTQAWRLKNFSSFFEIARIQYTHLFLNCKKKSKYLKDKVTT